MNRIFPSRQGLIILLALFCCTSAFSACSAQESAEFLGDGSTRFVVSETCGRSSCVTVKPQDEVWLVSARNVNCCDPSDLGAIEVKRLVAGQWLASNLSDLTTAHSADRTLATTIYTHGNNTDEKWARSRGLQVYANMFVELGACRPPVRFVIFAWRSEREDDTRCGQYIAKSRRAVEVGSSLAAVLAQFDDRNIVLSAFSLGSQVVLAALGDPKIQTCANIGKYRVFLIAPALDGSFVSETSSREHNSDAVERSEIFNNSIDRALKASRFIGRKVSGKAGNLSISELAETERLPLAGVRLLDVANQVGRRHSVVRYSSRELIQNRIQNMLREAYNDGLELPTTSIPSEADSILLPAQDLVEPSTFE